MSNKIVSRLFSKIIYSSNQQSYRNLFSPNAIGIDAFLKRKAEYEQNALDNISNNKNINSNTFNFYYFYYYSKSKKVH